jgi:hypothetical protein
MFSGRLPKGAFIPVVLCAVLLGASSGATAAIIEVSFTARVALVTFPGESGGDVPVVVGDPVVGWWSYDTDAEAIPFGGQQLFINPTTGFSFTVAGGVLTLDYDGTTGGMTISNGLSESRYLSVSDHTFSGSAGSMTGTVFPSSITYDAAVRPNWEPESALMSFMDETTGPPLPETLTAPMWILAYRTWLGPTSSTSGRLYIEAESVRFSGGSQIPEPATLALVALGLAGLGAARRRRR